MPQITANSVDAKISITTTGRGRVSLIAAACGEFAALKGLDAPFATMEMRGFGKSKVSGDGGGGFGLKHYVSDFQAAMSQLEVKKTALFGYSHSGYFTTAYAIANPGNVSSLILVEPALYTDPDDLTRRAKLAEEGDGDGAVEAMLRYVDRGVGLDVKRSRSTTKSIMKNVQNNKTLAEEFRIRAQNPISDNDLQNLKMPVLLIGGSESHVRFMVERAGKQINQSSVWWVRGAGHLDLMSSDHAKEISSIVNLFLSKV